MTIEASVSPKKKTKLSAICKLLIIVGNVLTVLGCLAIVFGLLGFYDLNALSFGLSSGIRMVGTIAILGCLFSAIGYGISDFFTN